MYQRRIAELSNTGNIRNQNINEEPHLPEIVQQSNQFFNDPVPPVIEDIFLPDSLVERARDLENEVQAIIREHNARGIW
jgi:hypothetical protein